MMFEFPLDNGADGDGLHRIAQKILNDAILRALATPAVKETLAKLGVEPKSSTPEEFTATIRSDIGKWARVVKDANIALE